MPLRCTVCSRPDAGTINVLLSEGRSARSVAVERGMSEDAVQRHAAKHTQGGPGSSKGHTQGVPSVTGGRAHKPLRARNGLEHGDPLDELVDALRQQALAGNPAIVHQYRLAVMAQADVRHAAPPRRDLATEPEWIALRTRLLDALEPFADARMAVVDAIEGT